MWIKSATDNERHRAHVAWMSEWVSESESVRPYVSASLGVSCCCALSLCVCVWAGTYLPVEPGHRSARLLCDDEAGEIQRAVRRAEAPGLAPGLEEVYVWLFRPAAPRIQQAAPGLQWGAQGETRLRKDVRPPTYVPMLRSWRSRDALTAWESCAKRADAALMSAPFSTEMMRQWSILLVHPGARSWQESLWKMPMLSGQDLAACIRTLGSAQSSLVCDLGSGEQVSGGGDLKQESLRQKALGLLCGQVTQLVVVVLAGVVPGINFFLTLWIIHLMEMIDYKYLPIYQHLSEIA